MTNPETKTPFVAIACGGTGGHLFPGLAVAEQLKLRGCDIALLISPKDVDQQAVKSTQGMDVFQLPAVGLQNRTFSPSPPALLNPCLPREKSSTNGGPLPFSPWADSPVRRRFLLRRTRA